MARLSDGSEIALTSDVPEYDEAFTRFKEICARVTDEETPEWIEGSWSRDPLVRTSAIIALRLDLEIDWEKDETDRAGDGDEAKAGDGDSGGEGEGGEAAEPQRRRWPWRR